MEGSHRAKELSRPLAASSTETREVTKIGDLRNFVMKYNAARTPGVLVIDMPREMAQFSASQLQLIEEYTNIGRRLEGDKFGGETAVMNSHLVIFSNHPPPAGILHKCVRHLKVRTRGGRVFRSVQVKKISEKSFRACWQDLNGHV